MSRGVCHQKISRGRTSSVQISNPLSEEVPGGDFLLPWGLVPNGNAVKISLRIEETVTQTGFLRYSKENMQEELRLSGRQSQCRERLRFPGIWGTEGTGDCTLPWYQDSGVGTWQNTSA